MRWSDLGHAIWIALLFLIVALIASGVVSIIYLKWLGIDPASVWAGVGRVLLLVLVEELVRTQVWLWVRGRAGIVAFVMAGGLVGLVERLVAFDVYANSWMTAAALVFSAGPILMHIVAGLAIGGAGLGRWSWRLGLSVALAVHAANNLLAYFTYDLVVWALPALQIILDAGLVYLALCLTKALTSPSGAATRPLWPWGRPAWPSPR